jgi:hypothetical protein
MGAALLGLMALAGACTRSTTGGDGSTGHDLRIGEGIIPPDVGRQDGRWTGKENVGAACVPGAIGTCRDQAVCLDVSNGGSVGVCALAGCTLEDLATPAVEDNCPSLRLADGDQLRTVCTLVQTTKQSYCFPLCKPDPRANSCRFGDAALSQQLACDPISILQNGHTEVCAAAACTKDADCNPNPLKPQYTCDVETEICRVRGTAGMKVGAPCKESTECGPGQHCYRERADRAGKTIVQNGYCTMVGCKYGGPWSCPAGSKCYTIGSPAAAISLCLAIGCDPTASSSDPDFCRADANPGQYDCTVQGGDTVCWLSAKK